MATDPPRPPADPAVPPEELTRIKHLVNMLPGVSTTGLTKSDGRWALKVWPKHDEEPLRSVIEALSKGYDVIYAGGPLRMVGTRPPLRVLLEDYWDWVKLRPEVATLFAVLVVALLTGLGVAAWQWHDAVQERDRLRGALAQANKEIGVATLERHAAARERDQLREALKQANKESGTCLKPVGELERALVEYGKALEQSGLLRTEPDVQRAWHTYEARVRSHLEDLREDLEILKSITNAPGVDRGGTAH